VRVISYSCLQTVMYYCGQLFVVAHGPSGPRANKLSRTYLLLLRTSLRDRGISATRRSSPKTAVSQLYGHCVHFDIASATSADISQPKAAAKLEFANKCCETRARANNFATRTGLASRTLRTIVRSIVLSHHAKKSPFVWLQEQRREVWKEI
jgi:hypothetical protein